MNFNTIVINATYFFAVALTYMILLTLVGYIQALIAKSMGDDTAEQQGFLTLNPSVHVDLFGSLLFLITYLHSNFCIGWGRPIPINPLKIQGRFRYLKLLLTISSGMFIYLLFAAFGLIGLAYLLNPANLFTAIKISTEQSLSTISVLHFFTIICIIQAAIKFISGATRSCTSYIFKHTNNTGPYSIFIPLIISLAIILLYGNQILIVMASSSIALAKLMAKFFFGA